MRRGTAHHRCAVAGSNPVAHFLCCVNVKFAYYIKFYLFLQELKEGFYIFLYKFKYIIIIGVGAALYTINKDLEDRINADRFGILLKNYKLPYTGQKQQLVKRIEEAVNGSGRLTYRLKPWMPLLLKKFSLVVIESCLSRYSVLQQLSLY